MEEACLDLYRVDDLFPQREEEVKERDERGVNTGQVYVTRRDRGKIRQTTIDALVSLLLLD